MANEVFALRIGVLALQGGFALHKERMLGLGAEVCEVRIPADLARLDGIVLPGGESTTMLLGIEREKLAQPLIEFCRAKPVLATCAGVILLAGSHLGVIDIDCERNAYGAQVHSFEGPVEIQSIGEPAFDAVFIRAPRIVRTGEGVQTLGTFDGDPVAVAAGTTIATTFHPELTDDNRIHERFIALASGKLASFAQPFTSEPPNSRQEAA